MKKEEAFVRLLFRARGMRSYLRRWKSFHGP